MSIEEYFNQKKEFYNNILKYIEDGSDSNDTNYQNLIQNIDNHGFSENKGELKEILRILSIISKNHHRYTGFFSKIEKILIYLKDKIKQNFSDIEIFNFFENNKLIILILLQNNIITIDKTLCDKILLKNDNDKFFSHFFYPEINDNESKQRIIDEISQMDPNIFDNFEQKRKLGENDSIICTIIRKDSVDEFVEFIKKSNFSLSNKIIPSIFETNEFLINKTPTLIEYATFYRSIQIIQYLRNNQAELTPSLWLYAIHGRSIELIHLLRENKIEPEDKSYKIYLKEAIKCHHNDMANYFLDNFFNKDNNIAIKYGIKYRNYYYMPKDVDNQVFFCYLCKYDYYSFVDFFAKTEKSIINSTIVLIFFK